MFLIHKIFAGIHNHGWLAFLLLAMVSFGLSVVGFISMSETNSFELWMLVQALVLGFGDLPSDEYGWLILAKVFWMLTFASAAFSLFLKDWAHKQLFDSIKDDEHVAIIGIGEFSFNYVNSLSKSNTIILKNNQNISGESYKNNGYAIKDVSLKDVADTLNLAKMQKAIINVGEDRNNINLAFHIIEDYISRSCQHSLRLIVRIENRELNTLFMSNKIFNDNSYKHSKIELKTYSFFEECASNLFQDNFIDGKSSNIIDSDEEYSIVIVGDGKLANKIVYEAAKIAHLPNENILNIYLVSNEPQEFKKSLIRSYPNIEKIPTLKLSEKCMDYKSLDFYTNGIWDIKNLTNVIVCYDDENTNLEIVSSMQEKTYLRKEDVGIKILFGVFNQGDISKRLNEDDKHFKIFKSFGNTKDILTVENIFDDRSYILAKLVNYTYDGLLKNEKYDDMALFDYKTEKSKVNKKWFNNTAYTDKTSSLAQAKHIKMKLKILGLEVIEPLKATKDLLKSNRTILDSKFDVKFEGDYGFPANFEDKLFDKMLRLEHNRWNAYHYLNGWEYSEVKCKDIKEHNCLLPIDEFPKYFQDKKELSNLIEWDIYSYMYIPNYFAELGFELREVKFP